ncbi:unnamed protein product [Pleuronectes platessa]|uniref:Uncharacterized protein n=1 Tax=Pleuronectes platessa TaxID=8262 RepID=A0A9N7YYS1_PLEPL|nr:unnamed protein product [Pleuronectes platessa]
MTHNSWSHPGPDPILNTLPAISGYVADTRTLPLFCLICSLVHTSSLSLHRCHVLSICSAPSFLTSIRSLPAGASSAEQSVIGDVMHLSVYLVWQSPQVSRVWVSTGAS